MSDLIDRQQAIDALKNRWLKTRNYEGIGEDIAEECEIYLRTVPSAQFATDTNVGIKLGANLAQLGTDCISRQAAIDTIKERYYKYGRFAKIEELVWSIEKLPSAQPERTCVNCGRTVNNGGWYADGGTRCPIEEHYALPKDGYCHLWEKRNVTDDDYPERREE